MNPTPWLPDAALHDHVVTDAIASRAAMWSERWFVEAKPVTVRSAGVLEKAPLPKGLVCWQSTNDAELLIALDAQAQVKIASLMLGTPIGWPKLSAADGEVAAALAAQCVEDLFSEMTALTGLDRGARGISDPRVERAWRYTLSVAGGAFTLDLYAPPGLVIAARKNALPAAKCTLSLQHRSAALASQLVEVGVMLGTGKVSLSELHSMTRGDVLVLDRGRGDAVSLAINNEKHPDALCVLIPDGDALKLRISEGYHDH